MKMTHIMEAASDENAALLEGKEVKMSSKKIFSAFMLLVTIFFQVAFPSPAYAAGTVGTGTAASCTPAALDAALTGGGAVNFNCGSSPVTITLASTKVITSDTQIDGGGLITLSGGNSVQIFDVQPVSTLSLINITLANGNSGPVGRRRDLHQLWRHAEYNQLHLFE